ncbi:hypothetical protein Aple_019840 [Acrocarpospora pleiomorpha]|uniref:Amidohydrolase-related domain-containing protein n=1 Tax=Acrocarpospora pleiomorpha TaxID=90975 RepID=A0A5M3XLP9_9ACTN|nr:DUF6282 family protein [Acrocarpospora pleiomorpha]GES19088.1 hypothetical protein Aple_019840 [Acrocarpospora pleiomorpha]
MGIGLRPEYTIADLDRMGGRPDPEVDRLLRGAVDLHTHPKPAAMPRRMDIIEIATAAAAVGYRAIVAKSHHHSMVPEILALAEHGLAEIPIQVYGGIALNHAVGGLNPYAVEHTLQLGGRVVWFPTLDSRAHRCFHEDFPAAAFALRSGPPISVLDDDGALRREAREILELIAAADAILNTGHLGAGEIDVLLPAAVAAGVGRILISHPDFIVGADPGRVAGWAGQGAHVEFCAGLYDRADGLRDTDLLPEDLARFLDALPADRVIISSDTGPPRSPRPVHTVRRVLRGLLDLGRPAADLAAAVAANPARLLPA